MQYANENLYQFIHEEVQKAGIFPHVSGCKYIACAIYYIFDEHDLMYQTMNLYKKIASQYDTTYTAVEHCIRHAITSAYDSNPEMLEKIVKPITHHPSNSEFVCTLAEKIRLQMMVEEKEFA
ncbi:MAG: sporulation initiation factor Spo0A C-terminal domain-containing protein [Oscillospiraceae bacterium]